MPSSYLVVGVEDTFAYATKYNGSKKQMNGILEDIKGAVGYNIKTLYDGQKRVEAREAIMGVSAIEEAIGIGERELFESNLQRLLQPLELNPTRIILIESNLN